MASKHRCPCCGKKTLDEPDFYDICPICGWEDDPGQHRHPDDDEGANGISLNQARAAYRAKPKSAQKYPCPCCGQAALNEQNFYNVCPVCGWMDFPGQHEDPDDPNGANDTSLNEARESYRKKFS